ncbi:hypothetical protein DV736_g5491, partial [Chaetothyriales sp. CBS 134916]
MTSILVKPTQLESHRHSIEPIIRSTESTPSVSRSDSVASNRSAYDGRASSLKGPSVTVTGQQTEKKSKSNWTTRLAEEIHRRKEARDQKKAEESARNEKLKREIDRIVASRHAAAVRAKLNAGQTQGVPVSSAHMSAAQQEMRYPHSGPPAIHSGHKEKVGKHNADMPALARIVSGDEVDDEEEYMKQHRDDWKRRTRLDERMRQLSEGPPSDDETLTDLMDGTGLNDIQDTPTSGVDVEGEKFSPKHRERKSGYVGYKRDRNGVWTKERNGPYILHNV